MLQRACGETADGVLGAHTLQTLQSMPATLLVARFNGERLGLLGRAPQLAGVRPLLGAPDRGELEGGLSHTG